MLERKLGFVGRMKVREVGEKGEGVRGLGEPREGRKGEGEIWGFEKVCARAAGKGKPNGIIE